MDNCTGGIYGGAHASAHFCMMDCDVSEAVIESDIDVGIWYVTGAGLDLMFQVWV